MRLLVLHQHYWPETAATAQLLTDLCEDLFRSGIEVDVLSAQPSYHTGQKQPALENYECRNGVHIHRTWSYTPNRRSIPQRLLNYGTFFGSSLLDALLDRQPDVVLVLSTPPLLLGVSGTLLKALKGVPFVYSVQDIYPDIAKDLGVLSDGFAYRAINTVSTALYKQADCLVTLSEGMAKRLETKGIERDRIKVIANWADTDQVVPLERNTPLRRELQIDDRFCLLYAGNLGLSQGLDLVLEAAALLADLPVQFILAGAGNATEGLIAKAEGLQLTNLRFVPPQPRDRLAELLAIGDIGLVPMRNGVSSDLVPSKLYGIMAAGRPVLACVETHSEVAKVIENHACGLVTEPENPIKLAKIIRQTWQDQDKQRLLGHNARQAAVEYFSRSVCTKQYERLIGQVANKHA
ncbi:MAG: glycosyltransferase family 4 protein [Myxococcales bacterium]|nr:MAG: glycosyltransferase family 4 protein [Myxococcales bacterium]